MGMNEEELFEILVESAVRRYGKARAKLLQPAIRATARSMASIGRHPVGLEEEPDFFTQAEGRARRVE
jgi:hypothetical protein